MRVTPIFLQLKLENLEWLGTLGVRAARKNGCGAAKRRGRRARVEEAFAGDCLRSVLTVWRRPKAGSAGAQ